MADKVIASEPEGLVKPEEFKFVTSDDVEMRVFSAETNKAFGRKLKKSLSFPVVYAAFKSYEAIERAGKVPNKSDIVDMINANVKATARAAFTAANLKAHGYKAPDPNDPQLLLRGMVETIFKTRKWTNPTESQRAEALKAAEAATGITWQDLPEELEPTSSNEEEEETITA